MIIQMEKKSSSTSRDRAQHLYDKTIELEKKRQKSVQARIPSDPNTWHQIRENYEAIILEDNAFSEQHNIEFALWQLHYKRIEEFRAHFSAVQASARSSANINGRAPPHSDRISKIRVQFKAFLSEATGFYHDLILKIRAKHGLPLGHFSEDSDNLAVLGSDTAKSSDVKNALVSCHRCLIYLGDLARYKGLYGEGESRSREYSAASSYYMQAASLWPSNGNPHHQLAILATYASDELVAVYRYFRSLAAEIPFPTAKDNLIIAFDKNRLSYSKLVETTKTVGNKEVGLKEKYKDFSIQFVRLHGILFSRTSLETFSTVLSSVSGAFRELLSSGRVEEHNFGRDVMENGLAILRLTATLIFTVFNVNRKNEGQTYAEILQHTSLFEHASMITFELMSLIVQRCLQLHDPSSSSLLPGILVFLEWLACSPDVVACNNDEKKTTVSKLSFWKHCMALLNKLLSSRVVSVDDDGDDTCFTNMSRYEEGETESRLALWEDFELRGFLPLLPAQSILDFSRKHSVGVGGSSKERETRVKRIIAAGKALASVAMVDQKAVAFDSKAKQFMIGTQPQVSEDSLPQFAQSESSESEQAIAMSSTNSVLMQENIQLLLQGEDEDEEIVFKPAIVKKQKDGTEFLGMSYGVPEQGRSTSVTNLHYQQATSEFILPSNGVARPLDSAKDFQNERWLNEPRTSVADGLKSLRFVENGHDLTSEMKGSLGTQNAGPFFSLQPSVSIMDGAMNSGYRRASEFMIPSKMDSVVFPEVITDNAVKPPTSLSATFKSQGGRPVRHIGPPPGFSPVPPKHVSVPSSSVAGTNGSIVGDDFSWLDGHYMPSSIISTTSMGLNYSIGHTSLDNTQFVSNSTLNGVSGLPFPGMHSSGVQFHGGSLKGYSDYQSLRNMQPNHGQKLLDQHHIMAGNQFNSQVEHYQGQRTWTGQYRV